MSVSSEDAARGVVGSPHAGNAAGWALAGEEKIRSSDGTQRVGGLREMGPRAWLAVAGVTRLARRLRPWLVLAAVAGLMDLAWTIFSLNLGMFLGMTACLALSSVGVAAVAQGVQ